MYVESRNMVQMNSFPSWNSNADIASRPVDAAGWGEEGQIGRLGVIHINDRV